MCSNLKKNLKLKKIFLFSSGMNITFTLRTIQTKMNNPHIPPSVINALRAASETEDPLAYLNTI